MNIRTLAIAASAFLVSTIASEAALGKEPLNIVVSASRIEQPIEHVGSSVTVLSGPELRERGVTDVAGALQGHPSLSVSRGGTRGSLTQVRVRGNEADHVLILVDGMRLADAALGQVDLANLNLDSVERIEVLLGPQSTLYGSDAIAGVINITTRKGGDRLAGQLHSEVGSLNSRGGYLQLHGGDGSWHFAATTSYRDSDGISAASQANGNHEEDGYDNRTTYLKGGYDHRDFQTWVIYQSTLSNSEFDDNSTDVALDEENHAQGEMEALSWVITAPLFNGRMANKLQLTRLRNDSDSHSIFFGSPSDYRSDTDRQSIEYQGSVQLTDGHTLQFGAESLKERLESTYFLANEVGQQGVYLQWLATFGEFDLSLGERIDQHDEYGRYETHRLTANYRFDEQWRVRGSYGTGFKAPTLLELYSDTFGGNPDLDPERSRSLELGVDYQHSRYRSSLSLFDQQTHDLIRSVGAWPNNRMENVDKADSKGVELGLGATYGKADVELSISHIDASETRDGVEKSRQRVPDWSGNLLFQYTLPQRGERLWAEAKYRGERRDSFFKNFASEDVSLDDYWLFNLGGSFRLDKELTLKVRIDNLTDEAYEEIYSYGTRGTTGTVAVDWRF